MSAPHSVVVTGMGSVAAHGVGCEPLWQALKSGRSGIRPITTFDASEMPVQYAGEVRDFDAENHLPRPCPAKKEKSVQMGIVAAAEALRQAGLLDQDDRQKDFPVGVVAGSGLGPCREAEFSYGCFYQRGWKGVRPTTVPKSMFNALASYMSIYFGLTGANHVIAAACASGSAAIGHAYLLVKNGMERAVVCGGADSPLCPSMFSAWTNLRVLARHEDPEKASRPFDKDRNGLAISEAAAMVVLESRESAEARGAEILAEVAGYGASSDAHHLTAPSQQGQAEAMRRCLANAELKPHQIDYINAHGTSTEANDEAEALAIQEVFGTRGAEMPISSTKSMLGHSLGASGAIEFISCVHTIRDRFVTATINCDHPDPDIGHDYVPHEGREHEVRLAMSNSFAFGGNNSVVLLRRVG